MRVSRTIGIAMFAYANDHGGAYPTGKSSTEVFQKLIDENYINDPAIFFTPQLQIVGKTKATSKKLRPENVCWDVTVPLDQGSYDALPVIFSTGFRVNYAPNGSATLLSKEGLDGIAVCYHSNTAKFIFLTPQSEKTISNFIASDFISNGKKYEQLTPDGPLP
jgi:hypothetical protein